MSGVVPAEALPRAVRRGAAQQPTPSSLRSSGSLEQEAEGAMRIHPHGRYNARAVPPVGRWQRPRALRPTCLLAWVMGLPWGSSRRSQRMPLAAGAVCRFRLQPQRMGGRCRQCWGLREHAARHTAPGHHRLTPTAASRTPGPRGSCRVEMRTRGMNGAPPIRAMPIHFQAGSRAPA